MTMTIEYESLPFQDIKAELQDAVLVVTINRPKQLNSFGGKLPLEVIQAFELADRDDRGKSLKANGCIEILNYSPVRVVILTANTSCSAYCSGADLTKGWSLLFRPEEEKEGEQAHRDGGGQVSMAVWKCRKITIAAVNGHAAGVGMTGLQLPFDIRFAWRGAKLSFPFVRRGIAAEATSSYLLPKLLGHARASALFLSGATVSPDSPLIQGLYHSTFSNREEVLPAALSFAKELAANTSMTAVAFSKGLLQNPGNTVEENHLIDSRIIRILASQNDGQEGVKAFFEKRAPKFTDTLTKNLPSFYPWWRPLDVKHRQSKL